MRIVVLMAGVLAGLVMAVPVQAQNGSADIASAMRETGKWMLQVSDALEVSQRSYQEASPQLEALMSGIRSPEQARTAGTQMRQLVAQMQAALQRSNVALDQIGPAPAELETAFQNAGLSGAQIIADARKQNSAFERLHGLMEQLSAALAAGDHEKIATMAPRMIEGAFTLLDNQAMLIRNRQVLVDAGESTHQALGVQRVMYLGMASVMRAAAAAQMNGGRAVDLSPAKGDLEKLAMAAIRYGMDGRENVAREEAELARISSSIERDGSANEQAVVRQTRRVFQLEKETFGVADELATLLKQNAASMTQQQLARLPMDQLFEPFETIENRLADITRRQAELLSATR